jgi:hypothetical protein
MNDHAPVLQKRIETLTRFHWLRENSKGLRVAEVESHEHEDELQSSKNQK